MHHHRHLLDLILGLLMIWAVVWAVISALVYKPWRKRRLPAWEARWNELSKDEQDRMAAAARRGEPGADPDEAFLIAGSALMERSYWRGRRVTEAVLLAFGLFFVVGSIIGANPITILIGFALLVIFLVRFRRRRAVTAGIKRTVEARRLEIDS